MKSIFVAIVLLSVWYVGLHEGKGGLLHLLPVAAIAVPVLVHFVGNRNPRRDIRVQNYEYPRRMHAADVNQDWK